MGAGFVGSLPLLIIIVASLTFKFLFRNYRRCLPPGPRGWPIIGCFWSLSKGTEDTLASFTRLSQEYGPIASFWMGNRLTVVVSSPESIKEVYRRTEFSGRPFNYLIQIYNPNFTGIVDGSYSKVWKNHRKFAMKTLTYFGLGKRIFEEQIIEEAKYFREILLNTKASSFDPTEALVSGISNLICILVFGHRFDYSDKEFQNILLMLRETFNSLVADKSRDYIPVLRIIPNRYVKNHVHLFESIKQYLRKQIKEHSVTFSAAQPRDYIDAFLREMLNGNPEFTEDWLVNVLFDFFAAGTETTATALRWALLYLAKYPEKQHQIYVEITGVIGLEHEPVFEDLQRMPFTEAVMCEILRLCSVAPLALVHSTLEDTKINNYDIPKGADVYVNLWALHHSCEYWCDPHTFKPERFTGEDGKCRKDFKETFLPFGTGYRACMGEQLAKMEFFLFLTSILRTFVVTFPNANVPSQLSGSYKLVYEPNPQELLFSPRVQRC